MTTESIDFPLMHLHEQTEASFLPYGSSLRIVDSYGELELEYAALRKNAGLMDAAHRGLLKVTGKDRVGFLHRMLTNDIKNLKPGQGTYAYLLHRTGKIRFDLNVLLMAEATYLEVDSRLRQEVKTELERYLFSDEVEISDVTPEMAQLTLWGPAAGAQVNLIVEQPLPAITETLGVLAGKSGEIPLIVWRQDLGNFTGLQIAVPRKDVLTIWHRLLTPPAVDSGLKPVRAIGWAAFNMARIEAGVPWFGIDFTDTSLPMETGSNYLRAVSFKKGCYVGQEIVARMHTRQSVARKLITYRAYESAVPVAGAGLFYKEEQVGQITSSCISPMLGATPIALGLVKTELAVVEQELTSFAEGKSIVGIISKVW